MKNKMVLIIGVVVILFSGIFILNNMKNKKVVDNEANPYGDKKLHQETIDQLNDPLYQNIITKENLDLALENKEDITVYYFSPTCVHCINTTPIVTPLVDELGIDMKKMNMLEYEGLSHYDLEGTPTIIHYEKGVEVARFEGSSEEEEFRKFFEQYVIK